MKFSAGLTKPAASAAVFGLFGAGAACQALAMKRAEMGVVYLLVLGLEALAAFALSVVVLSERVNVSKVAALVLIVAGIALLERA